MPQILAFTVGFLSFYALSQWIVAGTVDIMPLVSVLAWGAVGFIATMTFYALGLDERLTHAIDRQRAMRAGRRGPVGLREAAALGRAKRATRK